MQLTGFRDEIALVTGAGGGIGAAMLFHAMCNVLARLLEPGWSLS